ncbi:MAG TPA: lipoprotein [Rhodanobacteraceae bacterium]|nr:lipoprotein [Rhodanobacteraceae bacterium]
MRRHPVVATLLLFGAGLLAGCGQKGPLFLPKPNVETPASAPSTPSPAASAALPAGAASAATPASATRGR